MIIPRAIRITRAARPGRERRVDRHFLPGCRACQHTEDLAHIFQRWRDFFDGRQHNMHPRQCLREVAIAFIGDDNRCAGFRDQEIGAGDADIRSEEFFTQHCARLGQQRAGF